MSAGTSPSRQLERLLAVVLSYGTWLATAVIAAGLLLAFVDPLSAGMRIVTGGIALFILMPVLRVILMLVAFLRERDYRFGAAAMLVLIAIALGFVLGSLSVLRR
jgi:uncharacterized membrane protein